MAQTGFTPLLIYSSSTGGNTPSAGNLLNNAIGSELAINIADGKLFYKDSGGSVQVIAWKTTPTTAGGTGLTSYTAGDTLYYASGTTLSKLAIGSSGTVLTSSGTAPQWSSSLSVSGSLTAATGLVSTGTFSGTPPSDGIVVDYSTGFGRFSAFTGDGFQWFTGGVGTTKIMQISSAGAITTATWNGATVGVAYGGTGLTSLTAGYIPYGNGTSAFNSSSSLQFDGSSLLIGTSTSPSSAGISVGTKGTVLQVLGGMQNTSWRIRERTAVDWCAWTTNINDANTQDDATKSSWMTQQGYGGGNDAWRVGRYPAGSSTLSVFQNIASNGIITMGAYGAGAATFNASGVISSVSDENWKIKDGAPLNPDEMIQKLEPGYWFYNNEKKTIFGAERHLGFYAQNVNSAIGPEAAPIPETYIEKDENGIDVVKTKPWGYYDRSVLAVVVMSLKNALITIQDQKNLITSLASRIDALETSILNTK